MSEADPSMFSAAFRLFYRSWQNTVAMLGTTTSGVAFPGIIAAVIIIISFLLRKKYQGFFKAWRAWQSWREPFWPQVWTLIKLDKPTWIPIVATLGLWSIFFLINLITTTYREHQGLLRHIDNLSKDKMALEQKIASFESIRYTEQRFPSTRPGAPHGLMVVVQAYAKVNLRSLKIRFDDEFEQGEGISDHFRSGYNSGTTPDLASIRRAPLYAAMRLDSTATGVW